MDMAKKASIVGIITLGILFCTSIVLLDRAYSRIDQFQMLLSECTAQLQQTRGELQQTEYILETTQTLLANTKDELDHVQAQLGSKQAASNILQRDFDRLESNYKRMEVIAEENKFFFYYTPLAEQQYGVDELDDVLSQRRWAREYSEYVFDCSEMSAYLERYLENNGFHTIIVLGKSPDGSGEGHAWLLVEVTQGKYMPVEATLFSIVYWNSPDFDDYFEYQCTFESIHEAVDDRPYEFDWWQS